MFNFKKLFSSIVILILCSSCYAGIINPQSSIVHHERNLLIFSTLLMLLIVVPVIVLTFWIAFRYREKKFSKATYNPEWSHSTILEIIWWGIPMLIISILAIVTWKSTHELSPHNNIKDEDIIEVQVIALNWKWLFIYPQYNIASLNELKIPLKKQVQFKITSAAPMNSFFIPQLTGQIYAMSGMVTKLHTIPDKLGVYRGFSANYTGTGFAHMQFSTHVLEEEDFYQWINKIKNSNKTLDWKYFWNILVKPSINNDISYYNNVDNKLFSDVIMSYMVPNEKSNGLIK